MSPAASCDHLTCSVRLEIEARPGRLVRDKTRGRNRKEEVFGTQLNSLVVNVIWRLSVTLSHCVTALKFGVWAPVCVINTCDANVCWRYGIHLHALSLADVGVPVGPSVAACRCTSCLHTVSATLIVLFSQRAQEAWNPGLGNWRGHPVSMIRANLFSLGGLRLPGHRWGQTVRSSLMPTQNARTGWERERECGPGTERVPPLCRSL